MRACGFFWAHSEEQVGVVVFLYTQGQKVMYLQKCSHFCEYITLGPAKHEEVAIFGTEYENERIPNVCRISGA